MDAETITARPTPAETLSDAIRNVRAAVGAIEDDTAEVCLQIALAIRTGDVDFATWAALRLRDRAMGCEGMMDALNDDLEETDDCDD